MSGLSCILCGAQDGVMKCDVVAFQQTELLHAAGITYHYKDVPNCLMLCSVHYNAYFTYRIALIPTMKDLNTLAGRISQAPLQNTLDFNPTSSFWDSHCIFMLFSGGCSFKGYKFSLIDSDTTLDITTPTVFNAIDAIPMIFSAIQGQLNIAVNYGRVRVNLLTLLLHAIAAFDSDHPTQTSLAQYRQDRRTDVRFIENQYFAAKKAVQRVKEVLIMRRDARQSIPPAPAPSLSESIARMALMQTPPPKQSEFFSVTAPLARQAHLGPTHHISSPTPPVSPGRGSTFSPPVSPARGGVTQYVPVSPARRTSRTPEDTETFSITAPLARQALTGHQQHIFQAPAINSSVRSFRTSPVSPARGVSQNGRATPVHRISPPSMTRSMSVSSEQLDVFSITTSLARQVTQLKEARGISQSPPLSPGGGHFDYLNGRSASRTAPSKPFATSSHPADIMMADSSYLRNGHSAAAVTSPWGNLREEGKIATSSATALEGGDGNAPAGMGNSASWHRNFRREEPPSTRSYAQTLNSVGVRAHNRVTPPSTVTSPWNFGITHEEEIEAPSTPSVPVAPSVPSYAQAVKGKSTSRPATSAPQSTSTGPFSVMVSRVDWTPGASSEAVHNYGRDISSHNIRKLWDN